MSWYLWLFFLAIRSCNIREHAVFTSDIVYDPFSNSNTAIVHNGDISSFGSNMNFLQYRGVTNLVGTDSEVVAFIVDYLARVENLSMTDIGLILSNPYDRFLYRLGDKKTDYILPNLK